MISQEEKKIERYCLSPSGNFYYSLFSFASLKCVIYPQPNLGRSGSVGVFPQGYSHRNVTEMLVYQKERK